MAKKPKTLYRCSQCGDEFIAWTGQCSSCKAWNSLEEVAKAQAPVSSSGGSGASIVPITDEASIEAPRESTGISELNRLLGGGMVPGSVVLLGGEPGIGKSTLLLKFTESKRRILYVTGEESAAQIKTRASRVGAVAENLFLLQDYSLGAILEKARQFKPEILLIDSIQAVTVEGEKLFPGSPSQIRTAAAAFMEFARAQNVCVWVTGHITKDGQIAGPKLLEHMVDVVLYFESERFGQYRFIRSAKNRYGSTGEIAVFEMTQGGLVEIEQGKSLIHLEDTGGVGSILYPQTDGSRTMPVEVQVLVTPASFAGARRIGENIDVPRIHMISAILEKFMGFQVSSSDIFVRIHGGTFLRDAGADLALLVAMASSYLNVELPMKWAAAGELSLTGKVRAPSHIKERRKTLLSHGIGHVVWGGQGEHAAGELKEYYFQDASAAINKLFEKSLKKARS